MAAARIQRWALLLSSFAYDIEYKKGAYHTNVDTLSRFPSKQEVETEANCFKLSYLEELPITSAHIKSATRSDRVLGRVVNMVKYGWNAEVDEELKPYYHRRDQLSIDNDCLLWGMRVVIPDKYRHHLLDLLHDTHPGSVKMKAIARSHIWWPNIDSDIEAITKQCKSCIQNSRMPPASPLQSWVWPKSPWERIHVDFAQKNNTYFLIVVDAHSKWVEVRVMPNIKADTTVASFRNLFSNYGFPKEIVSDNRPQFTSVELERFLRINHIRHTLVPPYHPSSNGAAERSVQSCKCALSKMECDQRADSSLNHKIARYMLVQHSTPHSTTGIPPSVLFLGRELRNQWSLLHSDVVAHVEGNQLKQKFYHDRAHVSHRHFDVGDTVLMRNKMDNPKWMYGTIMDRQSNKTWTVLTEKGEKCLHSDQMKPVAGTMSSLASKKSDLEGKPEQGLTQPDEKTAEQISVPQLETFPSMQDDAQVVAKMQELPGKVLVRRNPIRTRKPPDRLDL